MAKEKAKEQASAPVKQVSQKENIERLQAKALDGMVTLTDRTTGAEMQVSVEDLDAAKAYVSEKTPQFRSIGNSHNVYLDHPSQAYAQAMVSKAMGITDEAFYHGAIKQLVNAVSIGPVASMDDLNVAIAMVRGIEPRDQLETMLALQMVAVHFASLSFTRKMNHTETIKQLDLQERVVNKLMRTFATQMEALRKHRNGGNQKVVVEHVHVHEGGQAIVGNVTHGGRPSTKGVMQSHEQENLSVPVRAAMHSHVEEDKVPVPGSSRAR